MTFDSWADYAHLIEDANDLLVLVSGYHQDLDFFERESYQRDR